MHDRRSDGDTEEADDWTTNDHGRPEAAGRPPDTDTKATRTKPNSIRPVAGNNGQRLKGQRGRPMKAALGNHV
jgi:hypothetical protein